MESFETDNKLIRILLARLERISVDSHWAHRASGVRGSLIKLAEQMDSGVFIPHAKAEELNGDRFYRTQTCRPRKKREESLAPKPS